MENLKNHSVHVYPGIVVYWSHLSQDGTLDLSKITPKFSGCYATNNSTVCFIDNQEVFVTPYTRAALKTLQDAGFKQAYFYVPFSNGDVPKKEKACWEQLCEDAEQSYGDDYISDCNHWCDEHHIKIISDESMKACFCMPSDGVPVKLHGFDDHYYPVCGQTSMDCTVVDRLGKYCLNNGKVIFVYRDGMSYVAKGGWIIDELRTAGYSEYGIFVPFSNGEEITDPTLKARWENIPRK